MQYDFIMRGIILKWVLKKEKLRIIKYVYANVQYKYDYKNYIGINHWTSEKEGNYLLFKINHNLEVHNELSSAQLLSKNWAYIESIGDLGLGLWNARLTKENRADTRNVDLGN